MITTKKGKWNAAMPDSPMHYLSQKSPTEMDIHIDLMLGLPGFAILQWPKLDIQHLEIS